jgi:hypothetical protein
MRIPIAKAVSFDIGKNSDSLPGGNEVGFTIDRSSDEYHRAKVMLFVHLYLSLVMGSTNIRLRLNLVRRRESRHLDVRASPVDSS